MVVVVVWLWILKFFLVVICLYGGSLGVRGKKLRGLIWYVDFGLSCWLLFVVILVLFLLNNVGLLGNFFVLY